MNPLNCFVCSQKLHWGNVNQRGEFCETESGSDREFLILCSSAVSRLGWKSPSDIHETEIRGWSHTCSKCHCLCPLFGFDQRRNMTYTPLWGSAALSNTHQGVLFAVTAATGISSYNSLYSQHSLPSPSSWKEMQTFTEAVNPPPKKLWENSLPLEKE